ncbi:helix-turn-helix domain-containing protein [Streptococcus macacae]|uniref:DNA-binding helix-turn-helix protein n=1 Tax=Streptococcus macacae NCTC 11558 TaxID=764298 RepID=G5JYN4_9STRE|nr:helix-turn-helix transcriptional regulator [Streptococcus macacae]EHJ51861.1 DNA-binding helix-turn-helix protein [Streptococcus macacae NCTC 11558]SUN78147.1 transcriptional regulator [Streptococcus macacae NCTC 11558]
MAFGKTLRTYRKQLGLSQEKMAEKLHVSRQAITKWETGGGMPDIANLKAIADLCQVSVDDLLSSREAGSPQKDFLYDSWTEYDLDAQKHFDLKLGGLHHLVLQSSDSEKIKVRLASNSIKDLAKGLKVKIDETKGKMDVGLKKLAGLTETMAKEGLVVFVDLPQHYLLDVELSVNCEKVDLIQICSENFELDGRVSEVIIDGGQGEKELNSKLDMVIKVTDHKGDIAVNQVLAASKIYLPAAYAFRALKRGLGTSLTFEDNGHKTADFSSQDSENSIELNGFRTELTIIRNS